LSYGFGNWDWDGCGVDGGVDGGGGGDGVVWSCGIDVARVWGREGGVGRGWLNFYFGIWGGRGN